MKKQLSNKQALVSAAIAAIILLGASISTFAQSGGQRTSVKTLTGVGKTYGARDPETCQATGGGKVLSVAEAIASFKCNYEGEASNQLILTEDVSVQIGKAHPYDSHFGSFEPNIDTQSLIYPIRGSFKRYTCRHVIYDSEKDRNCWIDDHPHAEGECYKTQWGDWHCFMTDKDSKTIAEHVPPPGAGKAENTAQNDTKKNNPAPRNAPRGDNGIADKQPDKNADDTPAGRPKPDFSEMEKWFEIVKYEYSDPAGTLTFWVKPKTDTAKSLNWGMQFLDKNGDLVAPFDTRYGFGVGWRSGSGNAGEVMKMDCYTPSETDMERAVGAKIVRIK